MINKCTNFLICSKCMHMTSSVFDRHNLTLSFLSVLDTGIHILSTAEISHPKPGDKSRYFSLKKILFRLCMFRNCTSLLILVIVCYNVSQRIFETVQYYYRTNYFLWCFFFTLFISIKNRIYLYQSYKLLFHAYVEMRLLCLSL